MKPVICRRARLLLAGVLMAMLACLQAAAAPATYSGEAPVTSQSEAERAGALKSALADVVIRLSGDPGILARAEVAKAVADADKYVLQYRYRRDSGIDETSGAATTRLMLVAEFDSSAVDRMLAGLGLAVAGAAAPVDATPVERRIWISGIHSAEDYARGMGYLARQSLVRQAWPLEARGDGILVRLSVAGGLDRWLAAVDGEGVLRVNSASPPLDGIDATLILSP
ncbi:DUF2066 domain-containing protein [Dokdonella immobilis]|uniref:DUF2066 domain-containing protein n=1 Tax=Dokdonella immobilis TaxID=578942 RepID=UPI001587DEC5|nr:DUF2066 domain-containing protein [Dokdonella immobilis]